MKRLSGWYKLGFKVQNLPQAVVFIFFDSENNKVLAEKRRADAKAHPNEVIFPSGKIDKTDCGDAVKCLLRETMEEIGVVPTEYVELIGKMSVYTDRKEFVLRPFLITAWDGDIPDRVMDKGNPLIWQTLEEARNSKVKSKIQITKLIDDHMRT